MTESALIQVDETSFDATLRAAGGRVLLDFTAERCAPCRALLPIVTRIAESSSALRVLKIDVDDSPALAIRFGIRGIPTLVVLEGGQEVARSVGSASEARVRALVATDDQSACDY
jgi:thioredoxin 1